MNRRHFPLSHPRLPSIVALQLQGAWDSALAELSLLRSEDLVLLVEVNRAICLFRTDAFQDVARLAPGLSRLYPSTLSESDVTKLMMLLVSMGMVAHHRCYAPTETRRFATELSRFPFAVADLCRMPVAVSLGANGLLRFDEDADASDVVYVLVCVWFDPGLSEEERPQLRQLIQQYTRLDPLGRAPYHIFESVLMRDDIPVPEIDIRRLEKAGVDSAFLLR